MLDIKFIRNNPNLVKEGAGKKGAVIDIDKLLEVDKKRRELIRAFEDMNAQKSVGTVSIQNAKSKEEKDAVILKMRELDSNSDKLNENLKNIEKEFNDLMLQIPNLPQDDVPVGRDERDNVVMEEIGEKPKFDFKPKDYLTIAENLDLIDVKRAAKTSGTRFGFIKREAVLLEFALINLALDNLTKKRFIPVLPPVMLKSEMARGMGYLEQADANEAYYLPQDDLYLAGTAEQPLGTMHANEVLDEKDLPRRYVGFSTCFRREAGAYGKDTKGILRVHQFDKVEMFSFCRPGESQKEHQFFLEIEKGLMNDLKIPYQIVQICTGDLGFPAAAKYDIEAWFPNQGRYRETHSTSNCTDFQARRLNIRYQNSKSKKLEFVHTVNGTVFSQRPLLAIIENYQQKDGSIIVPEALKKYLYFKIIK
ncbi:MAG: serine--tRNA ligase [Candidatus Nealsonbacteria bacterium CG_4_10_14_0_2_um_filter_40_15]|uniref:Serine--tRNA ligase n=2 Tax=Candidatus Nealsoniibacteriota TaxID=1817911 RepID=A0A2M7D726_9BACT|nr:MAG: serine--tRNA ligase [Candidatus Nealsonbacteria bacterium CG02_land_8_20_14_3_00_40_11]PIZ87241.1 MAG: serine--tRNA ligase [Candidatus Nealsonbacteria bacterium CG_4_10_14_0_2_um_filter_40_15]